MSKKKKTAAQAARELITDMLDELNEGYWVERIGSSEGFDISTDEAHDEMDTQIDHYVRILKLKLEGREV